MSRLQAALPAALLLLAACRPAAGPLAVIDRLVVEEPPRQLEPGALGEERAVARWSPAALLGEGEAGARAAPAPESLSARSAAFAAREVALELDLGEPIAAERVDAIEVEVGHYGPGEAVLEWGAPGETPGGERRAVVPTGTSGGRAKRVAHRFRLAGHPEWRGAVGRLRLTVRQQRGGRIELGELIARRRDTTPERTAAVLDAAWKVDLGGEVREARPAVAGRPLRWRTAAPAGARLRFGYGVWPPARVPVRFTVRARSAGSERVVFEDTVPPGDGGPGGWRDALVELPRSAGGPAGGGAAEVELVFDGSAPGPPAGALAVWSGPELLAPGAPEPVAPDVVLISIDTLRADHLSLYGYPRPTSPAIDAWAAGRAAVFENAFVQATWTLPSHVSMLTGVEAYRHGVNYNKPAPPQLTTLAELLRGAGYRTVAITGGGFVHPEYGLGQGFERFAYWPAWRVVADELPAHVDRALELLSRPSGRPLFLFFHTYEVHHSNVPRRPEIWSFGRLGETPRLAVARQPETPENGFLMAKRWRLEGSPGGAGLPPELEGYPDDVYDSRILFMDRHLGRLLAALAGRGRPTVVALTSDHGELLGEHGLAGHYSLHDGNTHVPLVLSAPRLPAGGRRLDCQVRSIDLVPTLAELAGVPPPPGVDGGSLVPLLAEGCEGAGSRRAVTYGANGNRGVALRVGGRFALEVNNAVWPALAGRREARPLGERAAAPSAERVEGLVGTLGEAFLASVPGLRLRFQNPGPAPLAGALEGPPVGTSNLKSFDLPGPVIEYAGRHVARFTVPPGSTFHLMIEDPGDRWLRLRLEAPGPPAVERIELAGIPGSPGAALRLAPGPDGRWILGGGRTDGDQPSILLWRTGRHRAGVEAPEETDPEVRRRLEALGYL